ncbi:MAG: 50S ribosomal protein L6 [Patescibacteria group bacterium]|jgi:large subunit ribosomal protein L6|nr:50S ribosomal protein L6 [Patescibacteria group bacterium]
MSRIGKQHIEVPQGVEVKLDNGFIVVKGPKGELRQAIHPKVKVIKTDQEITVSVNNPEEKLQRSLWGLFQRLIGNMVTGVTKGFEKKLEVNGVGYKAAVKGKVLELQLGYSHPIEYKFPEGIEITVEKNAITVFGADKQIVGQTAAEIRSFRKPEPYKGKGIKYADEVIRRKAGKAAAKAGK